MTLPDALSMRQDLAVREVVGKSKEEQDEVDVWYGETLGNPRVPIQADKLEIIQFASPPGAAADANVKVPLPHPNGVGAIVYGS